MIASTCFIHQHSSVSNTAIKNIDSSPHRATYMRQWTGSALVQIIACCLFSSQVNWTLRKKLMWNSNQNRKVFNQENVICIMAAILSGEDELKRYILTTNPVWSDIWCTGQCIKYNVMTTAIHQQHKYQSRQGSSNFHLAAMIKELSQSWPTHRCYIHRLIIHRGSGTKDRYTLEVPVCSAVYMMMDIMAQRNLFALLKSLWIIFLQYKSILADISGHQLYWPIYHTSETCPET